MKRKLRSVCKSGKYVLAAFLILLMTILSAFSVSASSVYSNQAVTDSINGVPYTLEMIYSTGSSGSDFDSFLYSWSPIFYDRGSNPNGYHYMGLDRSEYGGNSASVNTIGVETEMYYQDPTRFNFSEYGYPLDLDHISYDNTGHFVGSAIVNNYIQYEKSSSLNVSSGSLMIKAQDFSCWTDLDGVAGTELFFDFRPLTAYFDIDLVKVSYSVYGAGSVVYTSTFTDLDFDRMIIITPDVLGYDDNGVYIYIHDLEIDLSLTFAFGYLFSYGSYPLRFNTVYTFNPLLYDYSYGVGGDPGSFNPAIPLLNYTEFIGNAVSGVLDLELFPGFTLGGIFTTVLAFVCVVWFLKLVAGG